MNFYLQRVYPWFVRLFAACFSCFIGSREECAGFAYPCADFRFAVERSMLHLFLIARPAYFSLCAASGDFLRLTLES